MFGSHLSIAGGMHLALEQSAKLGLDAVQVFTKNQQQWAAPALTEEAVAAWSAALRQRGWHAGAPPEPGEDTARDRVVSHASYLINLASPTPELREKSIALLREEIERCERLAIPLLVFHPGSPVSDPREVGVERIAAHASALIIATRGYRTTLCLENVVGGGQTVGRTFEELADLRGRIIAATGAPERIGFCIDTCHAHAAGYDLSTRAGSAAVLEQALSVLGEAAIRVLHVNDSKAPAGSRLDRHAHIGEGTIGVEGFGPWVAAPALARVPKIMETPKGTTKAGEDFDTINVARLRDAAAGRAMTIVALTEVVIKAPTVKKDVAKKSDAPQSQRAGAAKQSATEPRARAEDHASGTPKRVTPKRGTAERAGKTVVSKKTARAGKPAAKVRKGKARAQPKKG
ncbi:hypothetical protein BH11PLA1_BH11PLA1_20310 [soil metagenome]